MIKWESFQHHDMRTLLGYLVYYKEAAQQNLSIYDFRDACGGDGWIVQDVASLDDNQNPLSDDSDTFPYEVSSNRPKK